VTSEERTATIVADTKTLTKVRGGGLPKKMLKMKVDPEMYMKTKDRLTQ
jgi:hypothetical protein